MLQCYISHLMLINEALGLQAFCSFPDFSPSVRWSNRLKSYMHSELGHYNNKTYIMWQQKNAILEMNRPVKHKWTLLFGLGRRGRSTHIKVEI